MTFIKKKFTFFDKEAKKIKDRYGQFYLFSSNFGALSILGLQKIIEKNKYLKKYKSSRKTNNDYFTFRQSILDFNFFKKNLSNFLKQNPKFNLIIRPHPADQLYRDWKFFEKYSNVKVISDNDVVPWIIASNGLIHRGCTTSIDAFLLKKPTYYFLPNRKIFNSEKNITYKISKK